MLTSSASTDRRLLRFRSLGNTFPCRGGVGWVVSLPWVGSDAGDPHAAAKSSMWRRMGDWGWGGRERTQSLSPLAWRYLPLLGPEWGLQLPSRKKAVLQAGQEGQQVAPLREVQRGPLDAVLAHQHECATALWG